MISEVIVSQVKSCLKQKKKITFLVGAGISVESGIPTFRGEDGFWVSGSKNYQKQEIGRKSFFNIASHEVLKFYLYRKSISHAADPNPSHLALKDIEDKLQDHFALISQNVDGLHKKAGSSLERTYLIHGDHDFMRCGDDCTTELFPFPVGIDLKNREKSQLSYEDTELLKCPYCSEDMRPHVLWFDEMYNEEFYKVDTVIKISRNTGLLFIIGTSGATNLPKQILSNVIAHDALVVEVNPNPTQFSDWIKNYKLGMVFNENSSDFLLELSREIANLNL